MTATRTAALALALSAAALLAAAPSRAATAFRNAGIGQHQAVMGNIARAQRRNNAAISHVQNNIRASRRNRF